MKKKEEVTTTEIPTLARTMSELNRKFGAGTIGLASKMPDLIPGRVRVESAKMTEAMGGGFPLGRIVELYGPEHSGKTMIALQTVKYAQEMGLECVYLDVENSFDPKWAELLGVNVSKLVVTKIGVVEDVIDMLAKIVPAQPGVIVVDSLAAMIPRTEMEIGADDQTMALKARAMSRGLAKLNALNKKTLILWINQLRSSLTMYGAPTVTPGGMAMRHWTSIRVEVKRDTQLITESGKKTDTNYIGQVVNWKITKNKTSQPYKMGSFRYYFDGHIEEG